MNRTHTLVFYDGHCGLCHLAVRFALRFDPDGSRFRFAPLQGATLRQVLEPDIIEGLTDSIVVAGTNGTVLEQSDAVLLILEQIGGGWAILGRVGAFMPRTLRDLTYRAVARVRYRLFRRPEALCPLVPEPLKERFLP